MERGFLQNWHVFAPPGFKQKQFGHDKAGPVSTVVEELGVSPLDSTGILAGRAGGAGELLTTGLLSISSIPLCEVMVGL